MCIVIVQYSFVLSLSWQLEPCLKINMAARDYKVLKQIGSGQFGVCKKVQRRTDGKIFAWKEIDYGMMVEDEKRLLCQEVNLLRDLRHDYIVRYYDRIIDRTTCTLYLIMEWCEGGDLSTVIQQYKAKRKYIPEDLIWKFFFQMSLALQECSREKRGRVKVLHRDLKPANIFLDKHHNIKVGDFGLARIFHHNTSLATSFVGTPYYMAPEIFRGQAYNEKSDVWSLGCVLYELCAQSPPFLAPNQKVLASKVAMGKMNPIPSVYSNELQRAIFALLSPDPDVRPSITKVFTESHTLSTLLKEKELLEFEAKLVKWQHQLLQKEKELEKKEKQLTKIEKAVTTHAPLTDLNKNGI